MIRDLNRIPEVMIQERETLLGEVLPEQVTIKVSKQLGLYLQTQAQIYDRDIEYIARQTLELWAEDWVNVTMKIYNDLQAAKLETAEPKKRRNEHYYKCELAASLRASGLNIRTEFNTGSGDADIAIMGADNKRVLAIIEVKLALKNWRESHQASGQAKAYAEAVKAPKWFVVSATIDDERFVTEATLRYEGAAELILAFIKKAA